MKSFLGRIFILSFMAVFLSSCSCCLYFNHIYNAKKAFEKAKSLQLSRLDSLPNDSALFSPKEKVQWDRTIEKCSKILDSYSSETKYKPIVIFMMAESYRNIGDYQKSLRKYDEFERYFNDNKLMPEVEFRRAEVLFKSKQAGLARYALEPILANEKHAWYTQALDLASKIESQGENLAKAAEALEKLLATPGGSDRLKAQARWSLADIYFKQKKYEKSIGHDDLLKSEDLADQMFYQSKMRAINAHDSLNKITEAESRLLAMMGSKEWNPYSALLKMRLAQIEFKLNKDTQARERLLNLTTQYHKTDTSAQSWYYLADHSQSKLKDYSGALLEWDSCANAWPMGKWSQEAVLKRRSLYEFVGLKRRESEQKQSFKPQEEFAMAELFLFKLTEVDSAISRLENIRKNPASDTLLRLKSIYAQAFILDEYKKDTSHSNVLYRELADLYPQTTFGKSAKKILGLNMEDLNEDQSLAAFIKVESLWTQAQELTNIQSKDSLYKAAIKGLAEWNQKWPISQTKPTALLLQAHILELAAKKDEAKKIYEQLVKDYLSHPAGQLAEKKILARTDLTDEDITREKRRLDEMLKAAKDSEVSRAQRLKIEAENEKKTKEADEEVLQDFEELYQLQR
jgi:hypothetical protein